LATIDLDGKYLVPGLIDAHMHIESTKLWLNRFVEAVLPHGTVAIANDPHEMANVAGIEGVLAMIQAAQGLPFTFGFSASSCVPASQFESPGAEFGLAEMQQVLATPLAIGVAEVMNYPGVIAGDPALLEKIAAAGWRRVDGHAPGLRGKALDAYLAAGIESDHETVTLEEAVEKRRKGMWLFLRQGSASKNLATLAPTAISHGVDRLALCSDDREPDLLVSRGHMDDCIRTAVACGIRLEDAIVMATLNPAEYHGFAHLGQLAPGYQADMVVLGSLSEFVPEMVFHKGQIVARDRKLVIDLTPKEPPVKLAGTVRVPKLDPSDLVLPADKGQGVKVIVARDGSLYTGSSVEPYLEESPEMNLLMVLERHKGTRRYGLSLIRGFDLIRGAIASTVAHDAHNLMVVGANSDSGRRDMIAAISRLAEIGGGQVVVLDGQVLAELALPIAGLMTTDPVERVADELDKAKEAAKTLGCKLESPFMTLSFMGLSVIPELKLTDKGLVDVNRFELTTLTS
jgi:adenine deaminase